MAKDTPIAPTLKRGGRGKPYVSTFLSQIVHRWCIFQIHTITALFYQHLEGEGEEEIAAPTMNRSSRGKPYVLTQADLFYMFAIINQLILYI